MIKYLHWPKGLRKFNFVITAYILIVLICFDVMAKEKKVIHFATDEFGPFVSKETPEKGFFTEIITAVIHEMGGKAEYTFVPWVRCEKLLSKGSVWGIFPYIITNSRLEKYMFTSEIYDISNHIFYLKDNHLKELTWTTLNDLKKYTFGVVKGYYYEEEFKREKLKLKYYNSEKILLKALLSGAVDLIPLSKLVGVYLAKKYYPNELIKIAYTKKYHMSKPHHIMVSKSYPKSKEILKEFNASLERIKEKGIFDKILDKYR